MRDNQLWLRARVLMRNAAASGSTQLSLPPLSVRFHCRDCDATVSGLEASAGKGAQWVAQAQGKKMALGFSVRAELKKHVNVQLVFT